MCPCACEAQRRFSYNTSDIRPLRTIDSRVEGLSSRWFKFRAASSAHKEVGVASQLRVAMLELLDIVMCAFMYGGVLLLRHVQVRPAEGLSAGASVLPSGATHPSVQRGGDIHTQGVPAGRRMNQ